MRGREQHVAVFVLCAVDGVHDGGVGGEHDSRGGVVLVGAKIAKGHVRQVRFEVVLCLRDKRRSVGEEEHVGDVVPPAQHIDQAGGRSGFAGACGHDEKMLAHAAADFLAYGAYGCLLIIAVGDVVVYADVFKRQSGRSPFDDFFQIGLAEKEAYLPLGAALVVPEKGIEAVGREHDGALPETAFETVGVELGLRSFWLPPRRAACRLCPRAHSPHSPSDRERRPCLPLRIPEKRRCPALPVSSSC